MLPFLQLPCCDLLPRGQCSDCACPLSVSLRHKRGTLLQDCLCSCAAYNYLLTSYMYVRVHSTHALTNNHTKCIPAAIIAFQSDKSMYVTVSDPPPCDAWLVILCSSLILFRYATYNVYGYAATWQIRGMPTDKENKLSTRFGTVKMSLPLALGYLPFRYVHFK